METNIRWFISRNAAKIHLFLNKYIDIINLFINNYYFLNRCIGGYRSNEDAWDYNRDKLYCYR